MIDVAANVVRAPQGLLDFCGDNMLLCVVCRLPIPADHLVLQICDRGKQDSRPVRPSYLEQIISMAAALP